MNNNKLNLSIVIPCASDIRIKSCIESIDEDVEVLVVLNLATPKVKKIVNKLKVRTICIKERNLGKALNIGIEKVKHNKVILMDSDCIFEKGAIKKLYKGLNKSLIAKGMVVFQRKNMESEIIARVREYTNYDIPKPYNPFLAINKDIKKKVGNYFFDKDIRWTEDADLNSRIKAADIKVNYVFGAKVFHPPLSFGYDLRSAFRYGTGKRTRVEKGIASGIGTHFSKIFDIVLKKGILSGIYYFFWNFSYLCGYNHQMLKNI